MTFSAEFQRFWEQEPEPPLYADGRGPCSYAKEFRTWAEQLCDNVGRNATEASIDLATLDLTRRYFDWYRTVPPEHRAIADDGDHSCIFQVFRDAHERLWGMHLTAAPRSFERPKPPPPPPQPRMVQSFLIPAREED